MVCYIERRALVCVPCQTGTRTNGTLGREWDQKSGDLFFFLHFFYLWLFFRIFIQYLWVRELFSKHISNPNNCSPLHRQFEKLKLNIWLKWSFHNADFSEGCYLRSLCAGSGIKELAKRRNTRIISFLLLFYFYLQFLVLSQNEFYSLETAT